MRFALVTIGIVGLLGLVACGGKEEAPGAGPATEAKAPAKDLAPDEAMKVLQKAIADGHPEVMWDNLPASYQKDVTELKNLFAEKMDAEIWDKTFAILGKLGKIAGEKKDFILGLPMMESVAPEKRETATKNWDAIVGIFDAIVQSDIKTLEGLKSAEPRAFMAKTGGELLRAAARLAELSGKDMFDELRKTEVALVSHDGDHAVIRVTEPGKEPEERPLTRVEGRWVEKDMADDWANKVKDMREKFSTMNLQGPEKAQAMMMFSMVDGALGALDSAKTQAEFTEAVQGVMGMFAMPMAMAMGAMGEDADAPSDMGEPMPEGSDIHEENIQEGGGDNH